MATGQSRDPDFVVIGAGPNGLTAAVVLAREGADVLVVEAHETRAGGALASAQSTRPGFIHDVGAAFFPFAAASPAFAALRLDEHGLQWCHAPVQSAHPAPDGTVAAISRMVDAGGEPSIGFGDPSDDARWQSIARWHAGVEPRLLAAMLHPLLSKDSLRGVVGLLPLDLLHVARMFMASGRGMATRLFRSEAARRVIPGLALHTDVGPDDTFGAGIGYMLAVTATTGGYAVPRGGAGSITAAMLAALESAGGRVKLGARVVELGVHDRRVTSVELADGTEIRARKGVLANTSAPSLFVDLIDRRHLPGRIVRRMRHFARGWGTFKVDWALDGPVPWTTSACARAAVVHAGDSLDDLSRFTRQVRGGNLPDNPYLVIGQQSLCDPSRAPAGQHTLWAYSRVPGHLESRGGWACAAEAFADRVDARIEALAPGFGQRIVARAVQSPAALERMDANLLGGDLGGGSNAWHRQLIFRPIFPWFRHRTPIRGLYLCSSYTHPGAGVHGMCGYNAARMALHDM